MCINNTRITNFQYPPPYNALITKGLYEKMGLGNTSSLLLTLKKQYMKKLFISQERMKKVGEAVFATFDAARKSRTLTMQQLLDEGILSYRMQVYAI